MNSAAKQDSARGGPWTAQFLDQMRQTADPIGDATIGAIFRQNELSSLNSLWVGLLQKNQFPPQGLPSQLYPFLEESAQFPVWADRSLIAQAEDFFVDRGIFCLVSLLCASLPECYVLPNEAAVLGTTRNLEAHAYRRVFETTQLIVDVMGKGGLAEKGRGVEAAVKVRLMHAAIRHLILNMPRRTEAAAPPRSFPELAQQMPVWDVAKLGRPINQEDMAYTLLTFSRVILRSFHIMRIKVTPDEEKAYLHCWNIVGFLMGVREDLLAHTLEDAECLFSRIKERQFGKSEAGQALANALVVATKKIISHEVGGWLPRWKAKKFPPIIMRQLLDRKTLAVLKIERLTFFEWIVLKLGRVMVVLFESMYQKLVFSFGTRFGMLILKDLTNIPREWSDQLFEIPEQLNEK